MTVDREASDDASAGAGSQEAGAGRGLSVPTRILPRRAVIRGAATLGGAALLAACGSGGDLTSGGAPSTTGPSGVTVTDQRGKAVVLDRPAARIVTLPQPAASMLIAVDQSAAHLAGMHQASWVAMRDGLMGEMFPDALKIPHDVASQDFTPNVESILALKPDLVVQWGDRGPGITAPLENAGLKVAGLTYGSQADLAAWITVFATLLGKPERGRAMLAEISSRLEKAKTLAATRPASGPRIVYFLQFADGLKVATTKSYNDFYIKLIGGQNPAASVAGAPTGLVSVDKEQVLAWDPEIVLLGNFDAAMPADMYANPVWKNLSAVKSGRVYKVPLGGYRWDPPGQESPLMWQWLSEVSFPEPKSTLRDDIVQYYVFLYGRQPTSAQIDKILWTDANAKSASYGRFSAS